MIRKYTTKKFGSKTRIGGVKVPRSKASKLKIPVPNYENKTIEVSVDSGKKEGSRVEFEFSETKPKYVHDDVPDIKSFITLDGDKIKNLSELSEKLETMQDKVYKHHVNEEKNDFSKWVNDVMDDEELAQDLMGTEKQEAQVAVLKAMIKKLSR